MESIIQGVINKIAKYISSAIVIVRRVHAAGVCADSKEVQFRRSDDHGVSKRKEGCWRENGLAGVEAGDRQEKRKRLAAAWGAGKTETALNSVVSLPTSSPTPSSLCLQLEGEEVGHRALFPPVRPPPSYSVFAIAGSTFCHGGGSGKSKLLLN